MTTFRKGLGAREGIRVPFEGGKVGTVERHASGLAGYGEALIVDEVVLLEQSAPDALAEKRLKLETFAGHHGGLPEVPLPEGGELIAEGQAPIAIASDVDAPHLETQGGHLVVPTLVTGIAGDTGHPGEDGIARCVDELLGENGPGTFDGHDEDGLDASVLDEAPYERRVIEGRATLLPVELLEHLCQGLRCGPQVTHEGPVLPGHDAFLPQTSLQRLEVLSVRWDEGGHHRGDERMDGRAAKRALPLHHENPVTSSRRADGGRGACRATAHHDRVIHAYDRHLCRCKSTGLHDLSLPAPLPAPLRQDGRTPLLSWSHRLRVRDSP